MSGASSGDLSVSSWGWADFDGLPVHRNDATFRLWSVRKNDERVAMLLLSPDDGAVDVLVKAGKMLGVYE